MWLILAGLIFIGVAVYLYSKNRQNQMHTAPRPATPIASPAALPLYLLGVVLCFAAFGFFYLVMDVGGWHGFTFFGASILCLVGARYIFRTAYVADQKYAKDMQARADTHKARVEFERHDVALGSVRGEAERDAMMRRMQQEIELLRMEVGKRMIPVQEQTQFMQEYVNQRELAMRQRFIKPAEQQGMSVDQYLEVNEHWNRKLIDLEIRWREIEQDLEAAMKVDMADIEYNRRLLEYWEDMVRRQWLIAHSDEPDSIKDPLLKLYNKITHTLGVRMIKRKLDTAAGIVFKESAIQAKADQEAKQPGSYKKAYETGLAQNSNRQIAKGNPRQAANSRAVYPATAGDDED
jgi:hypothetical protein